MNKAFEKMWKTLDRAFPEIQLINWQEFGTSLVPYDTKTGLPKWTGLLTHFVDGHTTVGANTRAYAFLPRPESSAVIVVKKVLTVRHNPIASSMELRDKDKEIYGGAIRASGRTGEICAVTGLPEIGDHLLTGHLMRSVGLLSDRKAWSKMTDPADDHMKAAMEHVGMTADRCMALYATISGIVERASKPI